DGGGSTALALQFPNGKVRVVNTPIHKRIPGLERGVATCLGIALNHLPSYFSAPRPPKMPLR
ncbi:MAG: phosphodiester glycosidase family protein, partial [Spirochaetaceae bacterium]|nr:phosphodiester glycosidase family protein [Spirochaetaceae bacterium]